MVPTLFYLLLFSYQEDPTNKYLNSIIKEKSDLLKKLENLFFAF